MMRSGVGTFGAALVAALSVACSGAEGDEPVALDSQDILKGTTVTNQLTQPRVAALYHQSRCDRGAPFCPVIGQMFWFPRPCSSSVLRATNGETWILTARHCVTVDGEPDSAVIAPSQLRVNQALNPGVALPSPPAGSFTPDLIVPMPVSAIATKDAGFDLALVHVPIQLFIQDTQVSLMGPLSLPRGERLMAFGYGRFNDSQDLDFEDGTSGAGRLRTARDLPLVSTCTSNANCGPAGFYTYTDLNGAGQAVVHGDSGGPTFVQASAASPFLRLIGVHSTGCEACTGSDAMIHGEVLSGSVGWIESVIGHLYISPESAPTFNMTVNGPIQNGTAVAITSTKDAFETRWFWDAVSRRIWTRDPGGTRYFLTTEAAPLFGNFRKVYITPFTVAGGVQQWSLSLGRLWSDKTGPTGSECIRDGAGHVAQVGPCTGGTAQTWHWKAQP